jgi:hypothetical protein
MSNAQRLDLVEEVETLRATSLRGDPGAEFAVLEEAFEVQTREQRPMTLEEAPRIVRGVAAQVEAMGEG